MTIFFFFIPDRRCRIKAVFSIRNKIAATEGYGQEPEMNQSLKRLIFCTMSLAFVFGACQLWWPDSSISFKRLHIFLFNLLSGGVIILFHTERTEKFSYTTKAYFIIGLLYALSASLGWYLITVILSFPLFLVVEKVRCSHFRLLPLDFFGVDIPVYKKFNHASLLCLSSGIAMASLVILNNKYAHWIQLEKLKLDVFFLGYSFPISLIAMSVMFSFMTRKKSPLIDVLKEVSFWLVNLGVMMFFVFIIFEWLIPEITIATILFFAVVMIYFMFRHTAPKIQQKTFLLSGMLFLLCTGLTGLLYILPYFIPALDDAKEFFLVLHAMVSLYGWNLSGLFLIIRWDDFPLQLNSTRFILMHWTIALVLGPIGFYFSFVYVIAVAVYVALLSVVFLSRREDGSRV